MTTFELGLELNDADKVRLRNITKRRMINNKIKSLKDKITRYLSRDEDIQMKLNNISDSPDNIIIIENMIEESKLLKEYINDYKELIKRLQKDYCSIVIT